MAEHAPSTLTPELVSFEAVAALEFDPVPIDLEAVSIPPEVLNNPHMVHVRLAAVTLAKTKAELMDVVRSLGGLNDDGAGGELAIMVEGMQRTEALFSSFAEMLRSADARLFSAACAANLAEEAA